MTAIGTIKVALNDSGSQAPAEEITPSNNHEASEIKQVKQNRAATERDAARSVLYNRNPNSYRRGAADYGIDEFGHSDILKIYGYSKSEKIKRNPGAKGPIESTILAIALKEFCIEPVDKSRKAKALAEFMKLVHSKMKGNFTSIMFELADPGFFYGNNILECTYQDLPWNGHKFQGMRIYKEMIGRFNGLWELKETAYSEPYGIYSKINKQTYPIEKFILMTWLRRHGRNKGSGVYESVFKYLEANDIIYQKELEFMNRYAGKIPVAKYEDSKDADFALELAEAVKAGTAIAIPTEIILDFIDLLGKGDTNAFAVLYNYNNAQAHMAIKGTSGLALNNGTGGNTGSRASDEVKERKENIYELYLQQYLEKDIWLEQIAKRIIKHNFDETEYPESIYPKGYFKDKQILTPKAIRENLKVAKVIGVFKPEIRVDDEIEGREFLGLSPLPDKYVKQKRELEKKGLVQEPTNNAQTNLNESSESVDETEETDEDTDSEAEE